MKRIHLSAADTGALETDAVARVMSSGWIAPVGPELDRFEAEVAARAGVSHGVALSSGTAALHLSLLALGVGPDMVVPTSTFTFAATANAIRYTGARPFFIDSDPRTGNIDIDLLNEALEMLAAQGEQVGAILPVDIYGKAADHTRIGQVATARGIPVVADSAESFGAAHAGRPVGSLADVSAVSFNGNKVMTTSGGGMLLTDDAQIAQTARHLATQAREPVAHYEHRSVGYNYRLSNVLAAMGRAQLERLDSMIERRRQIRDRYRETIATTRGVRILGGDDDAADNCWLTTMVFDHSAPIDASQVARAMSDADIETRRLWNPLHMQPVFQTEGRLTNGASESLFSSGLALPSGSGMSDDDIDRVMQTLTDALNASSRPVMPHE